MKKTTPKRKKKEIPLTRKEKGFADGILEGKPGYKAAEDVYDITSKDKDKRANMAAVIASRNIRKDKVLDYLTRNGHGAATRIVQLSKKAQNETVRLNANKDILDRAEIGNQKNNTIIPIQINFKDDDLIS